MLKELKMRALKSAIGPVLGIWGISLLIVLLDGSMFVGKGTWNPAVFWLVVISIVLSIFPVIWAVDGSRLKELNTFLKNSGDYEKTLAELEEMYQYEPEKDVYISDKYIFSTWAKFSPDVHMARDIIWIYRKAIFSRKWHVPEGFLVFICYKDGTATRLQYKVDEEQDSDRILDKLHKMFPHAVFGYSDALREQFHNNRESMIAEVRKRKWK